MFVLARKAQSSHQIELANGIPQFTGTGEEQQHYDNLLNKWSDAIVIG